MSLHCATPTPLAATRSLLCVPPGPARAQPPRSKPDARQLERPGAAGAGVGAHSPVGRLRRRVGADGPGGASLLRPWIRRVRTRMRALRPRQSVPDRREPSGRLGEPRRRLRRLAGGHHGSSPAGSARSRIESAHCSRATRRRRMRWSIGGMLVYSDNSCLCVSTNDKALDTRKNSENPVLRITTRNRATINPGQCSGCSMNPAICGASSRTFLAVSELNN